ncbi:glioma pathogenesis-related protein 1-like [Discoglossus pictus]
MGIPEDFDPAFIKEYVDTHNAARSKVSPTATNMMYMTYDPTLAKLATSYADKCIYKHNPNRHVTHPGFKLAGENLFKGGGAIKNHPMVAAINLWAGEVKDYYFQNNSCIPGKKCGHYTQVVWYNTYKVGCGRSQCDKFMMVVCNYGPHGNFAETKPYTDGPSCSGCGAGDTCKDNLCMNSKRDEIIPADDQSSRGLSSYTCGLQDCHVIYVLLTFIHLYMA